MKTGYSGKIEGERRGRGSLLSMKIVSVFFSVGRLPSGLWFIACMHPNMMKLGRPTVIVATKQRNYYDTALFKVTRHIKTRLMSEKI